MTAAQTSRRRAARDEQPRQHGILSMLPPVYGMSAVSVLPEQELT